MCLSGIISEFTLNISISECIIQVYSCIANWMRPALLGVMSTPIGQNWSAIANISHKTGYHQPCRVLVIGNDGDICNFYKYFNIFCGQQVWSPVWSNVSCLFISHLYHNIFDENAENSIFLSSMEMLRILYFLVLWKC